MKIILLFIGILFFITGCASEQPVKQEIKKIVYTKNHFYIEEFIYKKEQIEFFEKEFENILKVNDKKFLEKFVNFYEKNASYFINGKQKVQILKYRISKIDETKNQNSQKTQLTKALSLNKKDAIKIYEDLAHKGNIFAQRELANIYKHEDKLKSIFWYKKLIENNDIQSIKDFAFANLHKVSPVVSQDAKRAVKLYEKLDTLGEISALVHLGNIYEYGYFKDDFPIDRQKSLKYFQRAALKGYTPAQKKLMRIYLCETCEGNRYNKEEGLKLLDILVEKGDKQSQEILENINSSKMQAEQEMSPKEEEIQEEAKPIEETEVSEEL